MISSSDLLAHSQVVDSSPSGLSGLKWTDERKVRVFIVESIQRTGMFLRLPQTTIATAQAVCQRFLVTVSLTDTEFLPLVAACLAIACKLTEALRALRQIVSAVNQLYKIMEGFRRPVEPLDLSSPSYQELKEKTVTLERVVLTQLGYQVYKLTVHPHNYILSYVEVLKADAAVAQLAWNYLNDSYRTIAPLCYLPHVIAVAAIYLAVLKANSPLTRCGKPWWKIFQVEWTALQQVTELILELYDEPILSYEDYKLIVTPQRRRRNRD
jgi:transcription initiation factor TFIIIB Brf1 subunit/transcription initiation factor TFIIB